MICPKCKAEMKPGARFCHVCGFDTQSVQQQTVNPIQTTNTMEQNTNQPAPEQQNSQGFDFSKIPTTGKVLAVIGLVGIIASFLPLYKINAGYFGSVSFSMINAWQGVICLLAFAGLIVFSLFGANMKMDQKLLAGMPKYMSYTAAASALIIILQLTSNSIPLQFLGIGFYLTIVSAAAAILVSHGVIKMK